jgi:hypothetical protein
MPWPECRKFGIAFGSICRIGYLVTPYALPISSRVFGWRSVRPNRIETTPAGSPGTR